MKFKARAGHLAIMEFINEGNQTMTAECQGIISHNLRRLSERRFSFLKFLKEKYQNKRIRINFSEFLQE